MKTSDRFSIFTQILNFAIVLYFTSFLIKRNLLSISDLVISFVGLLASILANIFSVIEED
jgi:hypothetical protein